MGGGSLVPTVGLIVAISAWAGTNAARASPSANMLASRVRHGALPVGAEGVAKVGTNVLWTPAWVHLEAGERGAHAWTRLDESAQPRDVQLPVDHQRGVDKRDVLAGIHADRLQLGQTAQALPEAPLLRAWMRQGVAQVSQYCQRRARPYSWESRPQAGRNHGG